MPSITLSIRLGPLVSFRIEGDTCEEIRKALTGFEELNKVMESMFSDLADRVYPDLDKAADAATQQREPREGAS
jgi:hypothetical protein